MANRIKGITVEIGGDTTKLSKALKNVDSSIKSTQSQLRDVNKLLKLDPGKAAYIAQKINKNTLTTDLEFRVYNDYHLAL